MSQDIWVTGMGTISSIGLNVEESYASLLKGETGIAPMRYLETRFKEEYPVGEVKLSNDELKHIIQPTTPIISRTILLGAIAAKEAVKSAGIHDPNEFRTGFISATSVGGMDISENVYQEYLTNGTIDDLPYMGIHDCGSSTEIIADLLGINDFVSTISTACSSSANSIMFGARLIKQGILERVIVGGTDALTRFTLNGFNSLKIVDKEQCQPFDANRRGLNLGEGAGFIVLESDALVQKTGKKPLCKLGGYGNTNDAFHQTASSPTGDGAANAMRKAMKIANVNPQDISYINVHGTGTPNNDLSEGNALMQIFGDQVPVCSSTKAFTGHTLGAAGGIEAVFSVLALQNQAVFPNMYLDTPISEHNFIPNQEFRHHEINHVLSNSLGFGGNCSALLFSKN